MLNRHADVCTIHTYKDVHGSISEVKLEFLASTGIEKERVSLGIQLCDR